MELNLLMFEAVLFSAVRIASLKSAIYIPAFSFHF